MVTFDINQRCPGSAVRCCPQDSSDHPPHTHTERGLYINTSLGGHLLDMRSLLPEVKKKKNNLQAVILLEVSLTALLSLWAAKRQNLQVGFFFPKKERKLCWLWSLPCFSSSQEWGVQWFLWGIRLTFWFRQCTFDFDVNPCNFLCKKKRLWHVWVVCAIFTEFPWLHLTLGPERPLHSERLGWKWSVT